MVAPVSRSRVTSPRVHGGATRALPSAVMTSSTPGTSRKRSADAARAATIRRAGGEVVSDVGDRRQRHHRVAQPVRRNDDDRPRLRHRSGIRLARVNDLAASRPGRATAGASRATARDDAGRTSPGTSVQRCVNSRTASGVSVVRRIDGMLVDEPVPSARQRQGKHRNHRRARAQRERRQRRRRRGGPPEEVHVDGVGRVQMLIDQHRDTSDSPPARAGSCRTAPWR